LYDNQYSNHLKRADDFVEGSGGKGDGIDIHQLEENTKKRCGGKQSLTPMRAAES